MKICCQNNFCESHRSPGSNEPTLVRNGTYYRASDSRRIQRYHCRICNSGFSRATLRPDYFQKKRRITPVLRRLLVSGVSQRRAALILKVDRKTVVRRFRYLAEEARGTHDRWLAEREQKLSALQFDDLETSEHTKCKPLSVALAIDPNTRKIMGFEVSQMPAKGKLSQISLRKYGYRKDERAQGWNRLLQKMKGHTTQDVCITSDENPHYPRHIKKHHPKCTHIQVPGGRGAITGQGELKKKLYDPMFALNHTCAMLRANINRLFRKTWCTTKTRAGLIDHLSLYVEYHNQILTPSTGLGAS